jgi:hypothetical protein
MPDLRNAGDDGKKRCNKRARAITDKVVSNQPVAVELPDEDSGTPPNSRCSTSAGYTTTCACTGPGKLSSGPARPSGCQTAFYLNDKYFPDRHAPNGYAEVAWPIAGKFDCPWFDRPIFGVIRYLSGTAAAK